MFMAAAPEGQVELDFEEEEAAILTATKHEARVQVVVEETGNAEALRGRLVSEEGPFEAVHLSCHGDIDAAQGPILLLEAAEGGAATARPGDVIAANAGGAVGVPDGGDGARGRGWRRPPRGKGAWQ